MSDAVLLPVDGNLAVFLEQQALGSANIQLLGGVPAESHLAGFLLCLRCGFVEDECCEVARKRNLGKSEGFQQEVGTAGELKFLPDHGIERYVRPETAQNRHVLYEFSIGNF